MVIPALALVATLGAWTSVGSIMTANKTSNAATTWAPTTSAVLAAGHIGVCAFATDEASGASNGDVPEHTALADAALNTWTKIAEFKNAQTSTAANGADVSLWYTVATNQLNSGAAITLTMAANTSPSLAASCWDFTVAAGSTVSKSAETACASGATGIEDDALDPAAMSCPTSVSQEHLFIRATASETNSATWTVTGGYTSFTLTSSIANTGTLLTSMRVGVEFKIETAATSTTSDPTQTSADHASVMGWLDETLAAGSTTNPGQPGWW